MAIIVGVPLVAPFRESHIVARSTAKTLVVEGCKEGVDYRGAGRGGHVRTHVEGVGKVDSEVQFVATGEPTKKQMVTFKLEPVLVSSRLEVVRIW